MTGTTTTTLLSTPVQVNYKGSDVKRGPGGYVKIRGRWLTCFEFPQAAREMIGERYGVSVLGWGETFVGFLSDYSPVERELLLTTLLG